MVKLKKSFACCFIVSVSKFCSKLPQVFCLLTPLGTLVPRNPENSTLPMPLHGLMNHCMLWDSMSDFDNYVKL